MVVLSFVVIYLICHFLFYVLYGRTLARLRTEMGIFMFHFSSFCIISVISCFFLYISDINIFLTTLLAVLALHGIYSLTFLEFWSLSQGGYSISILRLSPINNTSIKRLEDIGDDKVKYRFASLSRLGLVNIKGDYLSPTILGKVVIFIFKMFIRLTKLRNIG
jgi:hypothetical protein